MTPAIPYLCRKCQMVHLTSVFAFFTDVLDWWFVIILWSTNKTPFWHHLSAIVPTGYQWHFAQAHFIPLLFLRSSKPLGISCMTFWAYSIMVMICQLHVIGTVLHLWLVSSLTVLENKSARNSVSHCLSFQFLVFVAIFLQSSKKKDGKQLIIASWRVV